MTFGIGDAVAAGLKVIDKFIPDPAEKIKAEQALRDDLLAWDKTQTDINMEEAKHSSLFVAGWRPAIGWTCAFAFAFIYVAGPLITWVSTLFGRPVPLPSFNIDALVSLTMALLGMAGLRSWEKSKGLTK